MKLMDILLTVLFSLLVCLVYVLGYWFGYDKALQNNAGWVDTGSWWRHVQETKDGVFIDGMYTVYTDVAPDVNTWYKIELKNGTFHLTSVKTNPL